MTEAPAVQPTRWFRRDGERDDAPDAAAALKRNMPLVPADTIAGRALVIVIAIMTFLASLSAGAGMLVRDASELWTSQVAREMTVQVKPLPGHDIEAEVRRASDLVRATPGIASVRAISKEESERMLEPWLGTGLDLSELPIPRLIVIERGSTPFDAENLRAALRGAVPNAMLDDHRLWISRLATMARTLVLIVALIFTLVLVAMALAVAFATRGAMSGNREIIHVLHFVGAADAFITREFERHFLRLGLRGGLIGGGGAALAFALSSVLSGLLVTSPGGDQVEALFGTFALGWGGYVVIAAIASAIALLTGIVSRIIVYRSLRRLL